MNFLYIYIFIYLFNLIQEKIAVFMHLIESFKNLANVIKKANLVKKSDKIPFSTGAGMGIKTKQGINER